MTSYSHFGISVLFSLFQYISHYFAKLLLKFTCFFHTLSVFRFPLIWPPWCIYTSHNARTGRPWL